MSAWVDVGARAWSDGLVAGTGLQRARMPHLVEGSEASGMLRRDLAACFGMRGDVVIAGGGGDNAASAIGVEWERVLCDVVGCGTSGV